MIEISDIELTDQMLVLMLYTTEKEKLPFQTLFKYSAKHQIDAPD